MDQAWLIRNGKDKCIVFFNGWGMDINAIALLQSKEYDVYICQGYSTDNQLGYDFNEYEEVYLIAWSLGVFMANQILPGSGINFHKTIAINGTLSPCHDEKGIPEAIFGATLATWNEQNRAKFMMRMLGGKRVFQDNPAVLSDCTIEDQKKSLATIHQTILLTDDRNEDTWSVAIIGKNDLIFTAENQLSAWGAKGKVIPGLPHFPFLVYNSWDKLILETENAG